MSFCVLDSRQTQKYMFLTVNCPFVISGFLLIYGAQISRFLWGKVFSNKDDWMLKVCNHVKQNYHDQHHEHLIYTWFLCFKCNGNKSLLKTISKSLWYALHIEQELLTLHEHLGSLQVFGSDSFWFLCNVL